MKCDDTQAELVAYHFGTVPEGTRRDLEEHLLACRACLGDYLAVKREIETAEAGPLPSPAARQRLRAAVARELRGPEPRAQWSWWERPFAFGFAGAAVVVAMLALRVLTPGSGTMPRTLAARAHAPTTATP